jgi:hypothetical protein
MSHRLLAAEILRNCLRNGADVVMGILL